MTSRATKSPPTKQGGEGELKHYTPEEVYEQRLLPWKPRTLREMCQRYEIPHSRTKGPRGHIYFKLAQIRTIAAELEIEPLAATKPNSRAA